MFLKKWVFFCFLFFLPSVCFGFVSTPANPISEYRNDFAPIDEKLNIKADSNTGALKYKVAFTLPPGLPGATPDLFLNYNSQDRSLHNWAGYGMNLSIPYIERFQRNGVENLYTQHLFRSSLHGEIVSTTVITSEGVGTYGALSENGDFVSYELSADGRFTAYDKFGNIYIYGSTSTARIEHPSLQGVTYKWYLSEFISKDRNTIHFFYQKDLTGFGAGFVYPSRIIYGGRNSVLFPFIVEFNLEDREDILTQYYAGFPLRPTRRIKNISILVEGQLVRFYDFFYKKNSVTHKSLLSEVRETGVADDGRRQRRPPVQFFYTENSFGNYNSVVYSRNFSQNLRPFNTLFEDTNGDGNADLIRDGEEYPMLARTGEFSNQSTRTISGQFLHSGNNDSGIRFIELNGDYLSDIFDFGDSPNQNDFVNLNNFSGVFSGFGENLPDLSAAQTVFTDLNGDGLSDFIYAHSNSTYDLTGRAFLHKGVNLGGSMWNTSTFFNVPLPSPLRGYFYSAQGGDLGGRFFDLNSDGLSDYIFTGNDYFEYLFGIGQPGHFGAGGSYYIDRQRLEGGIGGKLRFADMNGDGILDIIFGWDWRGNNLLGVYHGLGSDGGYTREPTSYGHIIPFVNGYGGDSGVRVQDVNNDTLPDVIIIPNAPYMYGASTDRLLFFSTVGQPADLLNRVVSAEGVDIRVSYQPASFYKNDSGDSFLNPKLSIPVITVNSLTIDEGGGLITNYTYRYAEGSIHNRSMRDRRFAGFGVVEKTNDRGEKEIEYFHSGNGNNVSVGEYADSFYKIGKLYLKRVYSANGVLLKEERFSFLEHSLSGGRVFIYPSRNLETWFDYQSLRKEKGSGRVFDLTNGNILNFIDYGFVSSTASDSLFIDIENDKRDVIFNYARPTVAGGRRYGYVSSETLRDFLGIKVSEKKYKYENLGIGWVAIGNPSHTMEWIDGVRYSEFFRRFNGFGQIAYEVDEVNNRVDYSYERWNIHKVSISNSFGHVERFVSRLKTGQIKERTDLRGVKEFIVYDGLDRPVLVERQAPGMPREKIFIYSYGDYSRPRYERRDIFLSDNNINSLFIYFDNFGREIERRQENVNGKYSVNQKFYNSLGLISSETLPFFSYGPGIEMVKINNQNLFINYQYDALGRQVSATDATGTVTNIFSPFSVEIIDKNGNTKKVYFDAFGRLSAIDEILQKNGVFTTYRTGYEYTVHDKLFKLTDALSNVRHFFYDGRGLLVRVEDLHDPLDQTYTVYDYGYNASKKKIFERISGANEIIYSYDALGRLVSEDDVSTASIDKRFAYDNCQNGLGLLCATYTDGVSTTYFYSPFGQIIDERREILGETASVSRVFDRQNNEVSFLYPFGPVINRIFNSAGQVEMVTYGNNSQTAFIGNYDPTGELKEAFFGSGLFETLQRSENFLYRLATRTLSIGISSPLTSAQSDDSGFFTFSPEIIYPTSYGVGSIDNPEEISNLRTRHTRTYSVGVDKENRQMYKTEIVSGDWHFFDDASLSFVDIDTDLKDKGEYFEIGDAWYGAKFYKKIKEKIFDFYFDGNSLYFNFSSSTDFYNSLPLVDSLPHWYGLDGLVYKDFLSPGVSLSIFPDREKIVKDIIFTDIHSMDLFASGTDYFFDFYVESDKPFNVFSDGEVIPVGESRIVSGVTSFIFLSGDPVYILPPKLTDSTSTEFALQFLIEPLTDKKIRFTKIIPNSAIDKAVFPIRVDAVLSYYSGIGDGFVDVEVAESGVVDPFINFNQVHDWNGVSQLPHYNSVNTNYTSENIPIVFGVGSANRYARKMSRGFLSFDTSNIPDNAIPQEVKLSILIKNIHRVRSMTDSVIFQQSNHFSTSSIFQQDFGNGGIFGSVLGSTPMVMNMPLEQTYFPEVDENPFLYHTLNIHDPANLVSTTGSTKLILRHSFDQDGAHYFANILHYHNFGSAETPGLNYDPKLEVYYTIGSPPNRPSDLLVNESSQITISDQRPSFSAVHNDPDLHDRAVAYRLQISRQSDFGSLVYDSGRRLLPEEILVGSRSGLLNYDGQPLPLDGTTYNFRLKFFEEDFFESPWSLSSTFTMSVGTGLSLPPFGNLKDFVYKYDAIGNILSVSYGKNTSTYKSEYIYDDLSRLIFSTSTFSQSQVVTSSFTYDVLGNIINKSDVGNYIYGTPLHSEFANPHAATKMGIEDIVYDERGNVVSKGGDFIFSYNRFNELKNSTHLPSGNETYYGYDAFGRLAFEKFFVSSTCQTELSEIITFYNCNQLTTTTRYFFDEYETINNNPKSHYLLSPGGKKIFSILPNSIYAHNKLFYTYDNLGSIDFVVDERLSLVEKNNFLPFGQVFNVNNIFSVEPLSNDRSVFATHNLDYSGGFYHSKVRNYDPHLGRFLSVDPISFILGDKEVFEQKAGRPTTYHLANPQAMNSYSYAVNNPITNIDRNGEIFETVVDAGFVVYGAGQFFHHNYLMLNAFAQGNFFQANFNADRSFESFGHTFVDALSMFIPGLPAGLTRASISSGGILNNVKKMDSIFMSAAKHSYERNHFIGKSVSEISDLARQAYKNYDQKIMLKRQGDVKIYYYNKEKNLMFIDNPKNPTVFSPDIKDKYLPRAVSDDLNKGWKIIN